jgi:glycosyltransferase involved in cell wall biosynthesis
LAAAPVDLQGYYCTPDPKARVIVCAGHLIEPKGHETMLRAVRQAREVANLRLLILGEGHLRSRLADLTQELGLGDVVAMPGWVANPYPVFRSAHLVAVASWWEAFSRVLVEALALGTPVVSTDCNYGPREILQNGRLGRLVPVRDSSAMAQAILDTLEEPRRPAGRAGLWEYTEEEAVQRYIDVLALDPAN